MFDMPQFDVVTDALINAAVGVCAATADLVVVPVSALDPGGDAVGHGDLAGAIGDFCSRWQHGVANLVRDGDEYAQRLCASASAYIGTDVLVAAAMRGAGG